MKYLIFVLAIVISVSAFAQDDIMVKTDGTKYYFQVYDGETNEKVLQYKDAPGWQYKLFTADYFDGSENQLFSFKATEMYPGYFSIVNHAPEISLDHHLMSYSWYAYFDPNRNPVDDKEMQFKFIEVVDGWYKLETIEKPTDGSLYGINYTPGADALNVDENGRADFGDVKSDDITPENMVNKVFKLVEFDPLALFLSAIERSQELYDANPNVSAGPRYDLFYTMEKARETRLFGTEAEMLAFQPKLDSAVNNFNEAIELLNVVSDARTFIEGSGAGGEVKAAFIAIVDEVEIYLNSEGIDYEAFDAYKAIILGAKDLVNAIIAAENYNTLLQGLDDQRLSSGMMLSIDGGKSVLADLASDVEDYNSAVSLLQNKAKLINEIEVAMDLIDNTQDFNDAKQVLGEAVEAAIVLINNAEATAEELDTEMATLQDAVEVFRKTIEAGSLVAIENGDFENDFHRWNSITNVSWLPYIENKGVDGSKNMTIWQGADYQFMTSQSIEGIPNGTYKVSVMAQVNGDNSIALFAKSGESVSEWPLLNEGGLTKRFLEIEVANGKLQFGIRGTGEDNGIPANDWGVFDNFEVKWMSELMIQNPGFEDDFNGWTIDATPSGAAYLEAKGVDGSKSVTCWSGSDYNVKISQTLSGLSNGIYRVSAMANSNNDGSFVVFGNSGTEEGREDVLNTGALSMKYAILQVNSGTLEFGIKGGGENNSVAAGHWIVFDNFEVKIDTVKPDYVEVPAAPQNRVTTQIISEDENRVVVWQNAGCLHIRSSSTPIVECSIYGISGTLVETRKENSHFLSIPMNQGIFVVKVFKADGSLDIEKIIIQ